MSHSHLITNLISIKDFDSACAITHMFMSGNPDERELWFDYAAFPSWVQALVAHTQFDT